MKGTVFMLVAVVALAGAGLVASITGAIGRAVAQDAAPVFVKKIPAGYRDWKVVSVAHEAGELNDIRAVLGNDIAVKAYRDGKLPFPEGAIVGRIAWSYVASEENDKALPSAIVRGRLADGFHQAIKDRDFVFTRYAP